MNAGIATRHSIPFLAGFLSLVLLAASAQSGDQPSIMTRAALRQLNAAREVACKNPDDAGAWRDFGIELKNVGFWGQAVGALERAQRLGNDSPELFQAMGEALLAQGEAARALNALARGPDTAENLIAKSGAHFRLGRGRQAMACLDQALTKSPGMAARIRYLRAVTLASLGEEDKAEAEIAAGRALATDQSLAVAYDSLASSLAGPRRWGASATLGAGYCDNVTYGSGGRIGAEEISEEADGFVTGNASGWYAIPIGRSFGLLCRAGLQSTHNFAETDFSSFAGSGGVDGYYDLNPFRFEAGVTMGGSVVGGEGYHVDCSAAGAARWRQAPWTCTSVTAQGSGRSFLFDVTDEEDRDGALVSGALIQDFSLNVLGRNLTVAPSVQVGAEVTSGDSAKNTFFGAGCQAALEVVRRVQASVQASYCRRAFTEPHVRSATGAEREDDEISAGVGIGWQATDWLSAGLNYGHVTVDSNLSEFFSYSQNSVTLSATCSF